MAKKKKRIEKETRRLMDGIADLVKRKGDKYKFKTKSKKKIKQIKRTCPHWTVYKGGEEGPATSRSEKDPKYWECGICHTRFLVRPEEIGEYKAVAEKMLEQINQVQFWAVKMGGDREDTEMFLKLRQLIPRYEKVARQIIRRVNKRERWEKNRKNSDSLAQFDAYSGFNYRQ